MTSNLVDSMTRSTQVHKTYAGKNLRKKKFTQVHKTHARKINASTQNVRKNKFTQVHSCEVTTQEKQEKTKQESS